MEYSIIQHTIHRHNVPIILHVPNGFPRHPQQQAGAATSIAAKLVKIASTSAGGRGEPQRRNDPFLHQDATGIFA